MATQIHVSNYRVLFDRQAEGFPVSLASCLYRQGRLSLAIQYASDAARGLPQYLTESNDLGKSWSEPQPFGPPIADPINGFQVVVLTGVTPRGVAICNGFALDRGIREDSEHYSDDVCWRPGHLLIGRSTAGLDRVEWTRYPAGTFLGEQLLNMPGTILRGGKILLPLWGAAKQGQNWQCGALMSDDDGRTWRYRTAGYAADPNIRLVPKIPAGYNEETFFEAADGTLVNIIRGRERLGAATADCGETYFFRSISRDGGETWSSPALTNLSGTGACSAGLTLPDGSLLIAARVPLEVQKTWIKVADPSLFGLHLARSFDQGMTWQTERIIQHAPPPEGKGFDYYYNAMNGQFIDVGGKWLYVFGHFGWKENRHRILCFDLECR